jgi:hypothetical protein
MVDRLLLVRSAKRFEGRAGGIRTELRAVDGAVAVVLYDIVGHRGSYSAI